MGWRFTLGAFVAVNAWAVAGQAAEPASDVMVSTPTVTGQAPEHLVEALRKGVADGLSDAGVAIVQTPLNCDMSCLAGEVASGKARAFVTTEVQVTGSDYAFVVDILDGAGSSVSRQEGTCEICTFDEASVSVRELVARAAEGLGPPPISTGTVRIVSDPPGATVTVDGTAVGTTPYEGPLDEGAHSVELTLDGRERAAQQVEIAGGQTSTVELELTRRSRISPRTTEYIGWTAIGVGVAALAGGITMLVLDENPVESNCSGVHVDAEGNCEFRYDTLGGGIALTVAGVVAAGGGTGLMLYSRKKRQQDRGPAEVGLIPGGLRARF